MIPRKEIWGEVGLNLLVRGVWAGFFLAWGVAAHDIYDNPWAFGGMVVATACLVCKDDGYAPDYVGVTDERLVVFPWDYDLVEDPRFSPRAAK